MTLPQVPAIAAGLASRRVAGACLLLIMATLAFAAARADDQQDPYSATVKVDATADSAAAARTVARTDGQRHALDDVVARLSGSTDLSKMPKLDDQAITDMVTSFEVANEKMSTVRYLADYTFHFRPAKIRQLMRSADIAMAAPPSKPVVVVPVYEDGEQRVLWDDPNPWRDAWSQLASPSGPTKLVVPLGGVGDLTAIDAEQASTGDPQALTELAQRNDADGALVAVATARRDGDKLSGLDVTIKRYRAGQLADRRTDSIDAHPGESDSDFFKRAVDQVVAETEHGGPPAPDKTADKVASLDATIPINSLGDWVELRRRLTAVPGIHAVSLLSLSRHEAKVVIKFVGNPEQLKSNLAEADLDLGGADPDWRVVPAGAANPN